MRNKIKVAIVGVGNCAKALVEGVTFYKEHDTMEGLMNPLIGSYKVSDINFVAGFDVDERKIGQQIYDAIYEEPNCAKTLIALEEYLIGDLNGELDGVVHKAPVFDGVSQTNTKIKLATYHENEFYGTIEHIHYVISEIKPDVIVNFLPVGSQKATEFWADLCIEYKIPFVNCIPVFIASDESWNKKFEEAGVAVIGDDIKSQFGASILSQVLQEMAEKRGMKTLCHIQRNVGGNTDFLNMTDKDRLKSKKQSKENVIGDNPEYVYAGPSEYIPYLQDNKIADIHMEMRGFAGHKVFLDCKLSVQDSPNSAGMVVDAIRFAKLAQERKEFEILNDVSKSLCKTPL